MGNILPAEAPPGFDEEDEFGFSNIETPEYIDVSGHYNRDFSPICPFGEVSLQESLNFRVGSMFFSGLVGGGAYGLLLGMNKGKRLNFKLRLNSILNAMGKHSSTLSSRLALMGLTFTFVEWGMAKVTQEHGIPTTATAAGLTALMLTRGRVFPNRVARGAVVGLVTFGAHKAMIGYTPTPPASLFLDRFFVRSFDTCAAYHTPYSPVQTERGVESKYLPRNIPFSGFDNINIDEVQFEK